MYRGSMEASPQMTQKRFQAHTGIVGEQGGLKKPYFLNTELLV